jgi:hypothetical protein
VAATFVLTFGRLPIVTGARLRNAKDGPKMAWHRPLTGKLPGTI